MKEEIGKPDRKKSPMTPLPTYQQKSFSGFSTWHVVFVQDCNLRCRYCVSDFGSFGMNRGCMPESTWRRFTDFALAHLDDNQPLKIEFGGGETFLHFGNWLHFVDYLKFRATEIDIRLKISVTTNGICLNKKRMHQLADRGIDLTFSIDGPRQIHDRYRIDNTGRGTFDKAINCWEHYRELSLTDVQKPACNIHSVITGDSRLIDVIDFWLQRDVSVFTSAIQLPSRFLGDKGCPPLRDRQNRYLHDLKCWALDRASVLDIPGFLKNYTGPEDLFFIWKNLFFENEIPYCGAGDSTMAIDKDGSLYPCEGFLGVEQWKIGTIFEGINPATLKSFRDNRIDAFESCKSCEVKIGCPKNCLAEHPYENISDNFKSGCSFAKKLMEIAAGSYVVLSREKDC